MRETTITVSGRSPGDHVRLGITIEDRRGSIGSNDTVRIRVGAFNETSRELLAAENLTANVSGPAGNTDQFGLNATTGTASAVGRFFAGPYTRFAPEFATGSTEVNESVTFAVYVTDSGDPVAGVDRTVHLTTPAGQTVNETATTDANGVGTVSFTPNASGEYFAGVPDALGGGFTSFFAGNATGSRCG